MPICLWIVDGCFPATAAEMSGWDRDRMELLNVNYFLSDPLQSWPIATLKDEHVPLSRLHWFSWEQIRPSPEDFDTQPVSQ